MTGKQLQVYGARTRLAWFRKAEELGSVVTACRYYGIPRSEYYYWHKRWLASGKQFTSLYDLPRTPNSHSADLGSQIAGLILQLRFGLAYGEAKLAVVLARDYGVTVSRHGVGNVLRRAGLTEPKPRKRRVQRCLSDYPYQPGEVGQMDVKHWKRAAYQYDIVDCATRIKYKRLYPGVSPATTVDFLEHAVKFFGPAFTFQTIQTDKMAWSLSTTNSHQKAELQEFLVEDCLDYNFYRPHSMLRMLTPVEYLQGIPWLRECYTGTQVSYMFRSPTLTDRFLVEETAFFGGFDRFQSLFLSFAEVSWRIY